MPVHEPLIKPHLLPGLFAPHRSRLPDSVVEARAYESEPTNLLKTVSIAAGGAGGSPPPGGGKQPLEGHYAPEIPAAFKPLPGIRMAPSVSEGQAERARRLRPPVPPPVPAMLDPAVRRGLRAARARAGHPAAGNAGANPLAVPITPQTLQAGMAGLRRVDAVPVAHDLPAITVHRGADHAGEYSDLLADTRASISRLREGATGEAMLTGLQQRSDAMQPLVPPAARQPIVRIQSSRFHNPPGGNWQAPTGANLAARRGAYRYDGQAGAGTASNVHYDEGQTAPRLDPHPPLGPHPLQRGNRFIGLGHELVHAYRAAHGIGVSPPAVSPRSGDPILNPPTNPVVINALDNRAMLREEFETIGLQPTPQNVWQQRMAAAPPTENALRAEHQLPARPNYSGQLPGSDDQIVANVDAGTDPGPPWRLRWPWDPPVPHISPVQQVLRHLGA